MAQFTRGDNYRIREAWRRPDEEDQVPEGLKRAGAYILTVLAILLIASIIIYFITQVVRATVTG